jgi:hypothetical protein
MLNALAEAPGPVQEAAARAIRTLGLQQQLPGAAAAERPIWNLDFDVPPGLIWVVALAIVAAGLYYLWLSWRGGSFASDEEWRTADLGPAGERRTAEASLAAADALARDGRFVEAMHLLLLHSLGEIRRLLSVEFAQSLTSREIVRAARLPEQGRSALDRIVARVELTYFGAHPASRADYELCRGGFEELSGVLAVSRPA